MNALLSRPARVLLVRIFCVLIAVSALYGIYDNRDFLLRFPFYLLAGIDLLFASAFGYIAYTLSTIPKKHLTRVVYVLSGYWLYSTSVSLASAYFYAVNLGLGNVAQSAGVSESQYIVTELVHFAVLPALVFGLIALTVRSLR